VGTQTQTKEEKEPVGLPTTSHSSQNKCDVVKLEPMWTTEYLKSKHFKIAAFDNRSGLFESNSLPFSLTNSPGTFERLITLVLEGLQFKICLCYLDDIIIFAETFQEHL